jgi:hypothetical protein
MTLTATREELARTLAGDELSVAPEPGALGALPALVLEAGDTWLEGPTPSPGRVLTLRLVAMLMVRYADPKSATDELEAALEAMVGRLPARWSIEHVERPERMAAGEIEALGARMHLLTVTSAT